MNKQVGERSDTLGLFSVQVLSLPGTSYQRVINRIHLINFTHLTHLQNVSSLQHFLLSYLKAAGFLGQQDSEAERGSLRLT